MKVLLQTSRGHYHPGDGETLSFINKKNLIKTWKFDFDCYLLLWFFCLTGNDLNYIMCIGCDASSAENMEKVLPDHSILVFKLSTLSKKKS